MKHLGRFAAVAVCGLFLVAGVASHAAACDGSKTGAQKASAGSSCSKTGVQQASSGCTAQKTMDRASSGCAGNAMVQKASAGSCAGGASSCQGMTCSKSGKVMGTVQLIPTDTGFRVVTVGCKQTGMNLLKQSAEALQVEHHMKGEIHEASDGVYMDVEGDAAKSMYSRWQSWAKAGEANCLLTTESGDCLISTEALGVVAG